MQKPEVQQRQSADKIMNNTITSTRRLSGIAALAFARQGAKVAVADVSEQRNETVRLIEQAGGRALAVTAEGRAKVIGEEPVGRMGKPEGIAATVLWPGTESAGFVIGHALVVNGGQTIQ